MQGGSVLNKLGLVVSGAHHTTMGGVTVWVCPVSHNAVRGVRGDLGTPSGTENTDRGVGARGR